MILALSFSFSSLCLPLLAVLRLTTFLLTHLRTHSLTLHLIALSCFSFASHLHTCSLSFTFVFAISSSLFRVCIVGLLFLCDARRLLLLCRNTLSCPVWSC